MPYIADNHTRPSAEELRSRIPGWGADLAPADRPSVPKERTDLETGAHWVIPENQAELAPRERSIEHDQLPPVFGTAAPLHGVSGMVRRFAYAHYSEARTAHWLLLILGDRIDALGAHARALVTGQPDNPVTETGVRGEVGHHPLRSRFAQARTDGKHRWLDPIVALGPVGLAAALALIIAVRKLLR